MVVSLSFLLLLLATATTSTTAFCPLSSSFQNRNKNGRAVLVPAGAAQWTPTPSSSSSSLSLTRRDWIQTTGTTVLATLASASMAVTQQPQPALAEVWLTEPTEEFKANEAKAMDFKRAQLLIKGEFQKVLDRFTMDSKTEEQLVTDLTDLKMLVKKTGGLPLGVKKDELVKIIRRKKAAGFWPVPVEYAYQALTSEIAYQQSPNHEKDEMSPI